MAALRAVAEGGYGEPGKRPRRAEAREGESDKDGRAEFGAARRRRRSWNLRGRIVGDFEEIGATREGDAAIAAAQTKLQPKSKQQPPTKTVDVTTTS